jgi:parallel beta-helix repeat protein
MMCATVGKATGTDYYVAPVGLGGSDTNNGLSVGAPFLTLTHAVTFLTPGDRLNVRAGTYAESLIDKVPAGTLGNPVTIQGYAGDATPMIQPSSGNFVFVTTAHAYITLLNLILDGTNIVGGGAIVKITYTNASTYSHDCLISGCEIRNGPTGIQGVLISCGSNPDINENNRVTNCNIHHNGGVGSNQYHGIYCETNNNTFDNNTIHHNCAYGIQIFSSSATQGTTHFCSGNLIYNNIIHDENFRSGIVVTYGSGNLIYNNVIYNNGDGGIYFEFGPVNVGCYNNTIYNNAGVSSACGIQVDAGVGFTGTIENNICYQNSPHDYSSAVVSGLTADYNLSGDSTAIGAHSLTNTNPIFLNQSIADFRLGSLSTALNAGTTIAQVSTDILGLTRPQGSAYSMGAYDASYTRSPLTFYTATNGSDSNAGSLASPFLTIAHGLSQLAPTDTLFIRAGTYAEAMTTVPGGVDASHQITVSGYQAESVTVQPGAGNLASAVCVFVASSRKFITISNLTLDGTNLGAVTNGVLISSGGSGVSQDITVSGCTIINAKAAGVRISGTGTDGNSIINCIVNNNGGSSDGGITCDGPNNTVTGCTISSQAYGILLSTGSINADTNTINANTIHDCTKNGINVTSGTGSLISNNVIYSCTNEGIIVTSATGTLVYNNTLYNNNTSHLGVAGLAFTNAGSGAVAKNNILYSDGVKDYSDAASTTSDYNLTGDATATGAHSLPSTNPSFVNAAGANFELNAGSPAINAGVTLSAVPKDFLGMTRPQGTSYCIGAYEYPT